MVASQGRRELLFNGLWKLVEVIEDPHNDGFVQKDYRKKLKAGIEDAEKELRALRERVFGPCVGVEAA